MPESFDAIVIGAGPAGYVCAIRLAQLGKKTAIVEKKWLGGVCLNVGCIPSKALLKSAEVAHTLRHRGKELGFSFENLELDFSTAVRRSRQISDRLTKGVGFLMKKNAISVFMGEAVLMIDPSASRKMVMVTDGQGGRTELEAQDVVLATGASVAVPGAWKVDGERVVTYLEAITQERLPKSVIIIGAGAIGVEFATVWNAHGTEVTIVEMLPRILPLEDEEISVELERALKRRGIRTLAGHKVEGVESTSECVRVTVSESGEAKVLEADQALVAIGFHPNTRGLGLEEAGIKTTARGFVEIDDRMATNVAGVWGIGDLTGKLMLAHVGSAQGVLCAEAIAGLDTHPMDYEMMPRATFCHPQVASFGLTETQAREHGHAIKVGRFPFQANGKALGLGDYAGWVKIVTDEKSGEILGAHMIGPEVTELMPELTLARMMKLTPDVISRNVHAHPTLSETLAEAALDVSGSAIQI